MSSPQATAEILAYAPDGVGVGKKLMVGLQITHAPEWHTYWKNSGDSGQPTDMQWTLPAGASAGEVQWPVPKKIPIGRLANFGYEDTVLLAVPLEVSELFKPGLLAQELEVKLKAVWLVCRKECIPEEGEFAIKIPVQGSTALSRAAFESAAAQQPRMLIPAGSAAAVTVVSTRVDGQNLQLAIERLPTAWHGKTLELFPENADVVHTAFEWGKDAAQRWDGPVWQATVPLSAQRSASPSAMAWVLVATDNDGKRVGYRAESRVDGKWGPVAAAVQVPPALEAALKANAAAQLPAVQADGSLGANTVTSLLPALLLALLGGLILNLMPCVFPVLAIKVLGFVDTADRKQHIAKGLAYTAGVVLSFVALGALMLILRAGGEALGWGFQLQSPWVVALLALLFTMLGLNLVGMFEFASVLPSSVASVQAKSPRVDAFLSGVLAVAIASPCTAPFMGASLGFALGLPAWQALAVFAAIGLGMALPYLAASLTPAVARWLPRPGAWMDVFKKFMAFPMFATVAWLVWVLGQQSGIDGAASLLLLLVAAAMVVWAFTLSGQSRRWIATISIAACAILVWAVGQNVVKIVEPEAASSSQNAQAGGWTAWQPGKVEQLLAQNQNVFVDFTAAWCVTCQLNKKTTLGTDEVMADFAAKKVQLLRADWTRRDPAITAALAALGRNGVPVYVLYAPGKAPVVLSEILTVSDVRGLLAKL